MFLFSAFLFMDPNQRQRVIQALRSAAASLEQTRVKAPEHRHNVWAEAFNPAKPLKPSDVLTVYHGTSLGNVVHLINGFDATTVQKRYYNGPKHRGVFVAPTPEWARRFGDVVLEMDVRAKNLHGTDYSGATGRQHPEREQTWSEQHQDSFRPYLSQTMSQGHEPQALLIGLVSPKQVKRVLYKGQWYTRQKFLELKLKTTPAPRPGRSFPETDVADLGVDVASTKYSFDQFLAAVAKLADVDLDRAKRTLASRAAIPVTDGRDALLELLERLFEPTAAKAYAKKFRARLQEAQPVAAKLSRLTASTTLRVWHGTDSTFDRFDLAKAGSRDPGWLGRGLYFSTDPRVAKDFKRQVQAVVTLKKPLLLEMPDWKTDKFNIARKALGLPIERGITDAGARAITTEAQRQGFDGVVLDYSPAGYLHQEVVAFSPKSVTITSGSG